MDKHLQANKETKSPILIDLLRNQIKWREAEHAQYTKRQRQSHLEKHRIAIAQSMHSSSAGIAQNSTTALLDKRAFNNFGLCNSAPGMQREPIPCVCGDMLAFCPDKKAGTDIGMLGVTNGCSQLRQYSYGREVYPLGTPARKYLPTKQIVPSAFAPSLFSWG